MLFSKGHNYRDGEQTSGTQGGRTMSVTIQGSTKKGLYMMEQF